MDKPEPGAPMAQSVGPGRVHFIGAGPGDPELLTLKAVRLIGQANLILYAGSLVNPAVLAYARPGARAQSSERMPLEEQIALMRRVTADGGVVARLHTGDPAIFGAIFEQMRALEQAGVPYDIVPGVSSALAAAAALGIELTIPQVTQTVVFSRLSGKTPVPPREELPALAALGCSLVFFLSAGMLARLAAELIEAGYRADTPIAVVYRASWPDQCIIRGTLEDIAARVQEGEVTRQAIIIVSPALDPVVQANAGVSHLYGTALQAPVQREGTAIVTLTRAGVALGLRLLAQMPDARLYAPRRLAPETVALAERIIPFDIAVGQVLQSAFEEYRALIGIMASGIMVRALAPLLQNKHTDPAVVLVDAAGRYAVSLLSGHQGGANGLACRVAQLLGGQAVLTTASDVQGLPALDLIGEAEGWVLGADSALTAVTAALVNGDAVGVVQESGAEAWWPSPAPANLMRYPCWQALVGARPDAALFIGHHRAPAQAQDAALPLLAYHPRVLAVGVGCNRGTAAAEVEAAITQVFATAGLALASICCLATATAKADEPGIQEVCARHGWELAPFAAEQLNSIVALPNPSIWAERALGVHGVCEPAAALAAGATTWLVEKQKCGNVTVAVCLRQSAAGDKGPANR